MEQNNVLNVVNLAASTGIQSSFLNLMKVKLTIVVFTQ
jgi:hypothetical protein